ncbi:hypothetical protein LTR37_016460 [Vermiconidia calcicola]|uniref:Uncharacterized protein n=1 Tax=Vermiconidia calcicola TaxID=1690605 RepID=A0ACC3MPG8_9PEZI|nr:hypothetical protein LTR37_016460 [Vermiconidia calcicola]
MSLTVKGAAEAHPEQAKDALHSGFKEAKENKIDLDDDDAQVVEAMLRYLYTGNYGDAGNNASDLSSGVLDVRMFIMAGKYFIKSLKSAAASKFSERCSKEWSSPAFAQAVAEIHGSNLESEALKAPAVEAIKAHAGSLLNHTTKYEDFRKVLHNNGALGEAVAS